jgi:two-component system CheB/CheR fusion protein
LYFTEISVLYFQWHKTRPPSGDDEENRLLSIFEMVDHRGFSILGAPMPTAVKDFRVVCLGGSAGGLPAFMGILRSLPPNTGMAFVVAQHQRYKHVHLLSKILANATAMPVVEVEQGMLLEPNRVFVMPPGKDMIVKGDEFDLQTTLKPGGWPVTISLFLLSLAEACGHRAVAVILSGMGQDGSAALGVIKAAGGVTFAQSNPAFDSMPRHAVETGNVDFILPPPEIAQALLDLTYNDLPAVG